MLIFFLILLATSQICNHDSNQDDFLQTASALVTNALRNDQARERIITLPLIYNPPSSIFSVVASISDFQFTNQPSQQLDFSVRGGQVSQTAAQIIALISEDNSWTKLSVSYLITSRKDFIVGSFEVESYFIQKTAQQTLKFKRCVDGLEQLTTAYSGSQIISVLEISGIRSFAPLSLDLKFSSQNIQNNTLAFSLSKSVASQFEQLFLSYIIFPADFPFSFQRNSYLQASTYSFVGLSTIKSKQFGYEFLMFTKRASTNTITCVGSGCSDNCIPPAMCQKLSGMTIGNTCYVCEFGKFYNKRTQDCLNCSPTCKTCRNPFVCVTCPDNYGLSRGICEKCSSMQTKDEVSQKCVNNGVSNCPRGTTMINQRCQSCSFPCLSCSLTTTYCNSCVQGYNDPVNGQCCPESTFVRSGVCLPCVSPCKTCQNQITCSSCLAGYKLASGSCTKDCSIGQWKLDNLSCKSCGNYCVECSSASTCQTCQQNFIRRYDGTCCAPQSCTSCYIAGSQCLQCSENCVTCKSLSECTLCQDGYAIEEGTSRCKPQSSSGDQLIIHLGPIIFESTKAYQVVNFTLPSFMPRLVMSGCPCEVLLVNITKQPERCSVFSEVYQVQGPYYVFIVEFIYSDYESLTEFEFEISIDPKFKSLFRPSDASKYARRKINPATAILYPLQGIIYGNKNLWEHGVNLAQSTGGLKISVVSLRHVGVLPDQLMRRLFPKIVNNDTLTR